MIDIVLDTNVLMAALLKRGGPNRRVLRIIIANPDIFRICYSSQIVAEYEDVLARPAITARGLQDEAAALLGLVKRIGCEVVPKPVYALVYPDLENIDASHLTPDQVEAYMEENRKNLNRQIASYEQISKIRLYPHEFEKTPKKSIKRFLYTHC